MKKIITILLVAGLFYIPKLKAQDGRGGLGVKGGIVFTTIGFDNEDAETHKNRFRIGGTAGLSYEFASEKSFAFEIGLLYDLRGTKEEAQLIGGNEIVQKNYIHYLALPANFKFYFGDNFNIHFGPYAAGLVGGKTRFELRDNDGDIIESKDYKIAGEEAQDPQGNDYLKRYDVGLQAGLEFVSDGGIGVGSRFSKGLLDITNDEHVLGNGYASTTEISVYVLFRF